LTYTARGFFDDGVTRSDQPATPGGIPALCTRPGSACPPNGTIHLKSREFEIRDTQWLAALVAQAYPDLDVNQVAISGGSYGGGESWLQATEPVWDANTFPTLIPHPVLPVLQLQVAVPKYPWTDLAYSLAPNGHPGPFDNTIYSSSQGSPSDRTDTGRGNPLGTEKASYIGGFFLQGVTQGIFEASTTMPTYQEGPIDIPAWAARALAGDPYDAGGTEDPLVAQIRRGLTEFRGSFYQDEAWAAESTSREVAVFSVSGWTDDLFPPLESFRQFTYLKSLDAQWPVALAVADVGHPRAQNPAFEWRPINRQAWEFLMDQIRGSHRQQTSVLSMPTVCGPSAVDQRGRVQTLTAGTPQALATGSLLVQYASAGSLRNPKPSDDPDNLQTDPVLGFETGAPGCRTSLTPVALADATARYTGYSETLDRSLTFVGLAHVDLAYTLVGAYTATLNARVWDVAPDGTALLMTRGTYRIDTPAYDAASQTIQLPLFGNHWRLEAGHRIRLDLTQVDYPTFLPSNSSTAILTFPGAQLVLPTGEAGELTIPGG
jgi:hypothetical protein